jgi:hypothetical protein
LKDEKKVNFKNLSKVKKIAIKRIKIKSDRKKKLKDDEIETKLILKIILNKINSNKKHGDQI